jgi:hypothetical protein
MDALSLSEFKKLCVGRLLSTARARTKKHRWDMETLINADDLGSLWKQCDGHCAVSGRYFSMEDFDKCLARHPFAPSLDRIDSRKGYTLSNTRLVCVASNFCMNQWGDGVIRELVQAAMKHGGFATLERSNHDWVEQREAIIRDIEGRLAMADGADKVRLKHVLGGSQGHVVQRP